MVGHFFHCIDAVTGKVVKRVEYPSGPIGAPSSYVKFWDKLDVSEYVVSKIKVCAASGCHKKPSYGPVGGKRSSAMHCDVHKPAGYENVVNTRCAAAECRKHPSFGPAGGTRSSATHSAGHKLGRYEDVVRKLCKTCTLRPANFVHFGSKTKQCFECDSSLWRRQKFKEEAFADALKWYGFTEGDIGQPGRFAVSCPWLFRIASLALTGRFVVKLCRSAPGSTLYFRDGHVWF